MLSEKVLLPLNFLIIYFVWGMTYIWMKTATSDLHPFAINFWQNFIAALALFALNFKQPQINFFKENFTTILTQSFFMLILGVSFITISVEKLPASFAAVVISSVPIWVAFFNAISERKISKRRFTGLLLGLVGVAFLLKLEVSSYQSVSHVIILLIAALSWSFGLFRMPRLSIISQPYLSSASQMLVAAVAYFIISLFFVPTASLVPSKFSTLSSVFALALLGSTLAFSSLNWLLKHSSPVKVSTYAYINPLVSILMAWILLGEKIKPTQLPYIGLILISVFIVVSDGGRISDEPN